MQRSPGFLAAYASMIELQVGPVSAILGLYALALVIGRKRPPSTLLAFALGGRDPDAPPARLQHGRLRLAAPDGLLLPRDPAIRRGPLARPTPWASAAPTGRGSTT